MKYKLFGNSGLRVSEICLGTMTFGTEWGWGSDYKTSKDVFDAFIKAGGNFLDTANRYTEGSSEKYLGEFIHDDRGTRCQTQPGGYELGTATGRQYHSHSWCHLR